MLASALVTVIVAFPAVVPGFTVTVFPLILAVAMFVFDEATLRVPLLPLAVNVLLFPLLFVSYTLFYLLLLLL